MIESAAVPGVGKPRAPAGEIADQVVVLSNSQQGWKKMLEDAGSTRVLIQSIQLRDVRRELESLLGVTSE